ncbi:MAG: DUF4760 domain-containing protein [Arcobacteraceae bacterium]
MTNIEWILAILAVVVDIKWVLSFIIMWLVYKYALKPIFRDYKTYKTALHSGILLGIFIGMIVPTVAILITYEFNGQLLSEIRTTISLIEGKLDNWVNVAIFFVVLWTAIVALNQYKQNNKKMINTAKWNKKYLAYTQMNDYVKELETIRLDIDKIVIQHKLIKNENHANMSYTDRRRSKKSLTHLEVHDWVCTKKTVTNSSEYCVMKEDGAVLIRNLISIINIYETIAIGIKEDMLDKELIIASLKGVITSNFVFMKPYIDHRRSHHNNPKMGEEWERLYNQIK